MRIYALFAILFIWSCDNKKETSPSEMPTPPTEAEKPVEEIEANKPNEFNAWVDYYKRLQSDFSVEKFKKDASFDVIRSESSVKPLWDKDFDPLYKDYLIYNSDSTQYIDIDSYKWGLEKDKKLQINADQEVVLVNIPEKKVQRILFYGPAYWVEAAYFKNDSTVVLLENSEENIPAYQEINLNKNTTDYYLYSEPLKKSSEYLKKRILSIYNKEL
ncbi:hypothetical protein EQP59_01110 [Ornithobacterium rhinotracheale]|uniref:Uncharacterized protein n=1 Tax=Ornithobacterium rhinotracheale TaxID=28251 RepID=A0A410JPE5_ORNRH|nr:hypothetical protein [Ornithobacterium rhinotracheale]QAR30053.1 hypothetical protein EQP59_01110 [Ornithobacterium rhinotracheale]